MQTAIEDDNTLNFIQANIGAWVFAIHTWNHEVYFRFNRPSFVSWAACVANCNMFKISCSNNESQHLMKVDVIQIAEMKFIFAKVIQQ
mgnify:CR=1 FL=1